MGTGDGIRAVVLKCPNCGANLTISPDVDTLACGYCGAQQIVRREGGAVSLKLLERAVAAVKENTDRIAAELALSRLSRDLAEVDEKLTDVTRDLKRLRKWAGDQSPKVLILLLCFCIGLILNTWAELNCCFAFVVALAVTVMPYQLVVNWILKRERTPLIERRAELRERRIAIRAQIGECREALGITHEKD